jgi:hypothetical protein
MLNAPGSFISYLVTISAHLGPRGAVAKALSSTKAPAPRGREPGLLLFRVMKLLSGGVAAQPAQR